MMLPVRFQNANDGCLANVIGCAGNQYCVQTCIQNRYSILRVAYKVALPNLTGDGVHVGILLCVIAVNIMCYT